MSQDSASSLDVAGLRTFVLAVAILKLPGDRPTRAERQRFRLAPAHTRGSGEALELAQRHQGSGIVRLDGIVRLKRGEELRQLFALALEFLLPLVRGLAATQLSLTGDTLDSGRVPHRMLNSHRLLLTE